MEIQCIKGFLIALLFNLSYSNYLEMHSKTTFPTSCRRHLVLCACPFLSLWLSMATERTSGFQTRRTATNDAHWSFLLLTATTCDGPFYRWSYDPSHDLTACRGMLWLRQQNRYAYLKVLLLIILNESVRQNA